MHGERAAAEPDTGQRLAFWMAFYALVVLAWLALWLMVQDPAALAARSLPALLADLCGVAAGDAGLGALYAMWAVMAAAMMAPTAAPALATWLALPPRASGGAAGTAAVLAGYLAVWAGAAAVLAGAQAGLAAAGLVAAGGRAMPGLDAALLLLAGGYQFSALKRACVVRCRHPVSFFVAHWRPGRAGAFAVGLRLGAVCLGCCWALMALGFAGGMTSLAWMGLATLMMVMEKLPVAGPRVTAATGWALLAAGAAALAQAVGGLP